MNKKKKIVLDIWLTEEEISPERIDKKITMETKWNLKKEEDIERQKQKMKKNKTNKTYRRRKKKV